MLIPKVKEQIREYLNNNCKDLSNLRKEGGNLIKDVFRDIFHANRDKLDSLGRDLEKLMIISLDLTESVFNNIASANILAATVILRWQIVISQLAFVCKNNPDIYKNWQKGIGIKESRLRSFLKKYKATGKTPKFDTDELSYEFYSDVYHMKYDHLDGVCEYYTIKVLNKLMKIDIKSLLIECQKYTYRILLVALEYAKEINIIDPSSDRNLVDRWNAYQDKFFQFRNKIVMERESILKKHGI